MHSVCHEWTAARTEGIRQHTTMPGKARRFPQTAGSDGWLLAAIGQPVAMLLFPHGQHWALLPQSRMSFSSGASHRATYVAQVKRSLSHPAVRGREHGAAGREKQRERERAANRSARGAKLALEPWQARRRLQDRRSFKVAAGGIAKRARGAERSGNPTRVHHSSPSSSSSSSDSAAAYLEMTASSTLPSPSFLLRSTFSGKAQEGKHAMSLPGEQACKQHM